MILQGEKVILRPMTPEEVPLFFKWVTDSDATPYWYGPLYGDEIPTYEEFINDWKSYYFDGSDPEAGRCFLILVNDRPIGQVNYDRINRDDDSVELDIIIADDKDKNKGYGSDALRALADFLFRKMDVKRCFIEAIAENQRAIRAYEKAGFTFAGTFFHKGKKYKRLERWKT